MPDKSSKERIQRLMRRWVSDGSGLLQRNVRPRYLDEEAPKVPYATVLVRMRQTYGTGFDEQHDRMNDDLECTHVDIYRVSTVCYKASVQWYRDGAMGIAERFEDWATSQDSLDFLQEQYLALESLGDIMDISEEVSTKWEERALMNISLVTLRASEAQRRNFIDSLDITTKYEN